MADFSIPADVRQFLAAHVRSVAELEILLLLRDTPQQWWTAADVYAVVLSNKGLVERILEKFLALGLFQQSPDHRYQFCATTEPVQSLLQSLDDLYRKRPNRLIQAIYEKPVSEIEEFAKAFRIRKDS